ncbi:hypothetical protein ALC57_02546 [Trachymyrmex cornetzi]|uniref:CCHC-type domain-containing protein n=1 Tax=Trachymyrmex cornetzi TaxID=471704 RepID=A0A151JNL1_9HYME|nr:hypothetical protein ALC57_02546 [Trachymyrmex cornetzi]
MKREEIERLSLVQLVAELKKYGLPVSPNPMICVDTLVGYYEENSETKEVSTEDVNFEHQSTSAGTSAEKDKMDSDSSNSLEAVVKLLTEKVQQQQSMLYQLFNQKPVVFQPCVPNMVPNLLYGPPDSSQSSVLQGSQTPHFTTSAVPNPTNWQAPITGMSANPSSVYQTSSVLTTVPTAQAITLLASQIPQFNGVEEEVDVWIPAVSKMSKHARDWFDMDVSVVPGSWDSFKAGITRRFRRHIPFNVALQKAETRLWTYGKDSFQEYAMAKLKLLHRLHLPQDVCINVLIGGITNFSIRSAAASLSVNSVDEFLDRMHQITSVCGTSKCSSPVHFKKEKSRDVKDSKESKDRTNSSVKKPSSPNKEKDVICAYCKIRGHLKADCRKLKRKEQLGPTTPASSLASSQVAAVKEAEEPPATQDQDQLSVGCVDAKSSRQVKISDSTTEINSLDNRPCSLLVLLDTGSPVSFIQESVSSPSKLLFGYDKRNHLDSSLIRFLSDLAKTTLVDRDFEKTRDRDRDIAIKASDKLKQYNKLYYDKHHKTLFLYKIGDFVLIRDSTTKPGENRKLKPVYKGPYLVAKVLDKNRYVIQDIPGSPITQKPYNSILSPDRIKLWIKPVQVN